ncbi:MAG: hypothetical protein E6767_12315 [Dysgonomonas sp.]|nr:hypothetical protein [Dysgonomonas sp.]
MKYTLYLLLTIYLFFSCSTNKKQTAGINQDATAANDPFLFVVSDTVIGEEAYDDPWDSKDKTVNIDSLKKYLEKEKRMREALIVQLKNTTPEQADFLYTTDGYKFYLTKDFETITGIAMPTLMRSSGVFSDHPLSQEDELVIQLLEEHGLEPQYVGEGYTELYINPHYYYEIFKPYITEETSEYISILAGQDGVTHMDAGMVVPLEVLYKRCIEWEVFLSKYPETKHKKDIIQQYGIYMGYIMFCTADNTLAFDRETKKLNSWVLESVNELLSMNTDSHANFIIKEYMKELQNNDYIYSEEIENKIMSLSILKDFNRENVYY